MTDLNNEKTDPDLKAIFQLKHHYHSTTPPPSYYPKPQPIIDWRIVVFCGVLVTLGILCVQIFGH
jgi:hypothetical protein